MEASGQSQSRMRPETVLVFFVPLKTKGRKRTFLHACPKMGDPDPVDVGNREELALVASRRVKIGFLHKFSVGSKEELQSLLDSCRLLNNKTAVEADGTKSQA